jgi:hypothetical protein
MPQGPISILDIGGGTRTTLNVTTSGTVVTPVSRISRVSVLAAGSGALVINDATTVLGATTPNEVWNVGTAASAMVNMPLHSVGGRIAISYE